MSIGDSTSPSAIDPGDGPIDDGQRLQPEEVELHESGALHVDQVKLRHQATASVLCIQRDEISEARRRDHHAAGMAATFRTIPSSLYAMSMISATSSSLPMRSRSSATCATALSRVMPTSKGMSLESRSASP